MMEAPNGRGRAVRIDRAVNAATAAMRSRSASGPSGVPPDFGIGWRLLLGITPILEISTARTMRALKKMPARRTNLPA